MGKNRKEFLKYQMNILFFIFFRFHTILSKKSIKITVICNTSISYFNCLFFSQERLILFFPAQMIISVNYLNIINNNLFQEPNITLNNYPPVNARVNWNTKKKMFYLRGQQIKTQNSTVELKLY